MAEHWSWPGRRVLVTGPDGFVGSHLIEALLTHGADVHALKHDWRSVSPLPEPVRLDIRWHIADLTDPHGVETAVLAAAPEVIFHLAARSFVPDSWIEPVATFQVNTIGAVNLLEAVRVHAKDATVLLAGTSEEYGLVAPDECPITEEQPLRPLSPYGVSKVAQDLLGYQYARSYGLRIVRLRPFNTTGPRRGAPFVESRLARQIAQVMAGTKSVVRMGNLDAIRDFTDVRDVARAYLLAAEHGRAGEVYNIASGVGRPILAVFDCLVAHAALDPPPVLESDESLFRPSDVPRLIGDSTRAWGALCWSPRIPFEDTMRDLLAYWVDRT